MALAAREKDGVRFFVFEELETLGGIVHAFSTRRGGTSPLPTEDLNLGFSRLDAAENVRENRRRFFRALGQEATLVTLRQLHGDSVALVGRAHLGQKRPVADAAVTGEPGIFLGIETADCLPTLLVDPSRRVVASAHAGWRGTVKEVARKTVEKMKAEFGTAPGNLLAAIGPSIGACCYEVGPEVIEACRRHLPSPELFFSRWKEGKAHLDLVAANCWQLEQAGLRPERILAARRCTACDRENFFSYRRDGPTGRLLAVVGFI
ncbi:MAG: peptidoglycan editing factor PgeF [Acidobacteria bacterium]|nr:peptidoglycan editing factor PgeF [Acidobacteriota bacterium]